MGKNHYKNELKVFLKWIMKVITIRKCLRSKYAGAFGQLIG